MSTQKLPALFISHGGGPWPWMGDMKELYKTTVNELLKVGKTYRPKAILIITAHWETSEFTLSTSPKPEMIYDYGGFPSHTYQIKYDAPGAPDVAARVQKLLSENGIKVNTDANRGFDHGTFVPLYCMYPEADIPVVQLSIKINYSPADHYRLGEMLKPLRDEGILIVGSGLTYHNLRNFFNQKGAPASEVFEDWLFKAVASDKESRKEKILHWDSAPAARDSHPREDHLVPLFVIAGAAGDDQGKRLFSDQVFGIKMGSYQFG
jgi:aromatic ring-opening dioxygenase catalytic subunit (LigB family)